MLLSLLALIVIAGFLLYTYVSSERGAEYPDKGTRLSPADADLLGEPGTDPDGEATAEPAEPPAEAGLDDGAQSEPEPEPDATSVPRPTPPSAAEPEEEPEVADRPEARPAPEPEPEPEAVEDGPGASDTVRAFYSALGAGDGSSAARLVVPSKRRGGPLSAAALTRYYSSFRRPLRVRSLAAVDSDTVRVAYDYVLADGRVCRGQAAVDVVRSGGRPLVSGIRTSGPC